MNASIGEIKNLDRARLDEKRARMFVDNARVVALEFGQLHAFTWRYWEPGLEIRFHETGRLEVMSSIKDGNDNRIVVFAANVETDKWDVVRAISIFRRGRWLARVGALAEQAHLEIGKRAAVNQEVESDRWKDIDDSDLIQPLSAPPQKHVQAVEPDSPTLAEQLADIIQRIAAGEE